MKFLKYLLVATLMLLCGGQSKAQCSISYWLSYSVYASNDVVSYGPTNNWIYSNVLTNGNASMAMATTWGSGSAYCPDSIYMQIQSALNSATHYLQAENILGSTGGWRAGATGCASCYLSEQNQQGIQATPGVQYSWTYGANVFCSVGGLMNILASVHLYTELAFTEGKAVGAPTCITSLGAQVCTQPIVPWCTALTSPPDFYPYRVVYGSTAPLGANGYTLGFAVCNRSSVSGRWGCPIPGAPPVGAFEPDPLSKIFTGQYPLQPCTHNP